MADARNPMNHVTQLLLVALVALSGAATIVKDLPVLREITTFFALGGLIGGAVVYRAERAAYSKLLGDLANVVGERLVLDRRVRPPG